MAEARGIGTEALFITMPIYHLTQELGDVPGQNDWLSQGELAVLAAMRFPKRRNDWRLGRWTAKKLLSSFLGCSDPSSLEVRAASDGAPEAFLQNKRLPLEISISHSMNLGFCALSPDNSNLGCDLELVEQRDRDFLLDYFTDEERELADRLPAVKRPFYLTLIWSGKESALKSIRQGLRRDTKSVVVDFEPSRETEEWSRLTVRCTESAGVFCGWWRAREQYIQSITCSEFCGEPQELPV